MVWPNIISKFIMRLNSQFVSRPKISMASIQDPVQPKCTGTYSSVLLPGSALQVCHQCVNSNAFLHNRNRHLLFSICHLLKLSETEMTPIRY